MNRQQAYEIVINDIVNHNDGMLVGYYDVKHGSEKFMHGISTLLEYMAIQVSVKKYDEISEMFLKNMMESQKKAGVCK